MLFFSDVKQYIPLKLCKTAGSIHLFQIYGQLSSDQIVLEKNCLWHIIRINLRQGTSWYALDNIDYMLPPPMQESEI